MSSGELPEVAPPPANALRPVGASLAARLCVIPIAAVCGLLTARVIVSSVGVSGYGIAALAATLPALIPAADLGVGAAITTAVAANGPEEEVFSVLLASLRILLALSGLMVVGGVLLAVAGSWSTLLGLPHDSTSNWAVGASVAVFGISLPLGLGSRVLLGSGRNHVSIFAQGLAAPLVLLICVLGHAWGSGLWLFAAAPALGSVLAGVAACREAAVGSGLDLADALRKSFSRGNPGARIRHIAGPMAVISAALPLAYQSDRLVLSHVSSVTQLAIYSAGAAIFAPMLSLVASGGQTLWPFFIRMRLDPDRMDLKRSFWTSMASFAGIGAALAVCIVAVGPQVATWMLHSQVAVPITLMASFGLLLLVHASYYPTGMLLTDPGGLRLQAKLSIVMLVCNLALSLYFARLLGAPGPALGSALSILLCMWLPGVSAAVGKVREAGVKMVAA